MVNSDKNRDEGVFEPIEQDDPLSVEPELVAEAKKSTPSESKVVSVEGELIPSKSETAPRSSIGFSPLALIVIVMVIAAIVVGFINVFQWQERANEARARLAMGQASMIDGDSYEALYQFTRAVELDPKLTDAHASLGRIAIENGQADEAVRKFHDELALNPDDRESHLALGCLYTLGCIPDDDPHDLRAYINNSFARVIPYYWPSDLEFTPESGIDSLTRAVYHFQYALEHLPEDPTPEIGLALTHIVNYDLDIARERLSKLLIESSDEGAIAVAQEFIEDINQEELYSTWLARNPQLPPSDISEPLLTAMDDSEPIFPALPTADDLSEDLQPLPGFGEQEDVGEIDFESFASSSPDHGGFGSRTFDTSQLAGNGNSQGTGTQVRPEDLVPQPTVKPITNDIHIEETNEWVRTVRIANIYETGSVGFRPGETIVMPGTNLEVTVIESSDDRIVLEERGYRFVWQPGEVGWVQVEEEDGEIGVDGEITEGSEGSEPAEDELGPEVE